MKSIAEQKASASALTDLTLFIKMKRTSDNFVSVNPNSPRKQRRKKPTSYGSVIHFGNTSATHIVSDSLGCEHTPDEKPAECNTRVVLGPRYQISGPGTLQSELALTALTFRLRASLSHLLSQMASLV